MLSDAGALNCKQNYGVSLQDNRSKVNNNHLHQATQTNTIIGCYRASLSAWHVHLQVQQVAVYHPAKHLTLWSGMPFSYSAPYQHLEQHC